MAYRLLVIGAGPAGLYLSKFLSKHFAKSATLDLLEKEYLPGGLLRWGVAPDHHELRSSIAHFDDLFKADNFNYYGGVHIRPGAPHPLLYSGYSAVILSTGAQVTKQTHLQNEELVADRVFNSTEFFHLYNGKPSQRAEKFRAIRNAKKVVIVGNGNVTIDMARLLTRDIGSLKSNDRVNPEFLAFLEANQIENIQALGRRGAVQAACAVKELKDLSAESKFALRVLRDEYEQSRTPGSLEECNEKVELSRRQNRKKLQLFEGMTARGEAVGGKELLFRFLLEPVGVEVRDGRRYLKCAKMKLVDDPKGAKAKPIEGKFVEVEFDILIKNLGFEVEKPDLLGGLKDSPVPVYVSGWAFSKGKGTIADLIQDSQNKALQVLGSAKEKKLEAKGEGSYFGQLLGRAKAEKEVAEIFEGHRIPERILDNEAYNEFRKFEVQKGMEITDREVLDRCLRKTI